MKKYTLGICAYNEGEKIRRVIEKFNDYATYDLIVINDASTDGSFEKFPSNSCLTIITNSQRQGAGYGVRKILEHASQKGYLAVFFVSGNDKDSPEDIFKLREAVEQGYDVVQGSRYLPGGRHAQMPYYRTIATRFLHPLLFACVTGHRMTDSTNGFRAVRLSFLNDPEINISQAWLDQYELEPYLLYKAVKRGYKVKEVPVCKIYPSRREGYTKMRPLSGWWSILRPLIYLGLGIRK